MRKKCIALFCLIFLCFASAHAAESENTIIVCDNGKEMLSWDLDFISRAKQSVELAGCLMGGEVIQDIFHACEMRMQECPALKVFILSSAILLEDADRERARVLMEMYPGRFHFQVTDNVVVNASAYTSIESHMKLLVVDECYFSIGGTNFDDPYCSDGTCTPQRCIYDSTLRNWLAGSYRDQDVIGRGPLAKEIRVMFHKLFSLWENYFQIGVFDANLENFADNHYFPVSEKLRSERFETSLRKIQVPSIKLIFSGPMDSPNKITKEYERLFKMAEKEIVIANLYVMPVEPIFDELLNAVNRGVSLQVISNEISCSSPDMCDLFVWGSRVNYLPLFYGKEFHLWDPQEVEKTPLCKTKIYEYHVSDTVYHKKVTIIDRRYVVIGSYNLSRKSDVSDYEIVMVMDSPRVAADLMKWVKRDIQLSTEISPQQAQEWYFNLATAYWGSIQKLYNGML